jgi:uncharacterized protein YbjT (DUF2867 family)
MIVVMGGTGHVGSAVAEALLDRGERVTIVTRRPGGGAALRARGAQVAQVDVDDADALREVFRRGRRAFVLNPPADTRLDTDAVERRTVGRILAALEGSGLEKVVAASTGGARPGERIGDLGVLWTLEQGLQRLAVPAAIDRAGYYMSNWDALAGEVRRTGELHTIFPAEFALPMVAPRDVARVAAARLASPISDVGVREVEGPRRYSCADVAQAFGEALGRPVQVVVTPRAGWIAAYRRLGFSEAAADAYARMTAATVDGGIDAHDDAIRGPTTLESYIRRLVERTPVT